MTARELIGFACLISGIALIPVGWIVSHKILLLAGLLIGAGAWLFYTERMIKKEERLAKECTGGGSHGPYVPADIHNYSGWRTGGRTSPLDSSTSEGGSDGD